MKKILVLLIAVIWAQGVMAMELTSSGFKAQDTIPDQFTCQGENVSPQLSWTDVPEGTKSFALICDDPDAPSGDWVHWVVYDIPGESRELPAGLPAKAKLADGTAQGMTDFGAIGYGGPCPPPGKPHRYSFRLYALDSIIELKSGAGKYELMGAMDKRILDEAELIGIFGK